MKLFITDLDGTLLDENNHASEQNLQALQNLKQQGYEIVIASGRQYPIIQTMGFHELNPYVISLNGSVVYDTQGTIIYEEALSAKQVKQVCDACDDNFLSYIVYTTDKMYLKCTEDFIPQIQEVAQLQGLSESETNNFIEDFLQDISTLPLFDDEIYQQITSDEIKIYKIEAKGNCQDKFARLEHALKEEFSIAASWETNREITSSLVNKGSAMEALCAFLQVSKKDCVAIGDNSNDLEMLEKAGYAIAMGNAIPKVKEICDMTTTNCEDHGVAKAIEQFLQKHI